MRVVVVTPPDPVVDWAAASAHLRLFDDDEQDYVEMLIAAATGHIDGPEGWLGRAIGVQTLEARFDNLGAPRCLRLPYPPVGTVDSVTWLDRDRATQVVDPAEYELVGETLSPIGRAPWAGGLAQADAIRVRYQAGYATVPAPIRHAILIMVADMFRQRESMGDRAVAAVAMPTTVKALLRPFWVWRG